MSLTWYILKVRTGRELILHELFLRAGFEVYTPFETKFQAPRSLKARVMRKTATPYASPLYEGYLVLGSDSPADVALTGIGHVMDRRDDVLDFVWHKGERYSFSQSNMDKWKQHVRDGLSSRKNIVLRGYDPRRDARKNQSRLYGQDSITIPTFTKGERVEFMNGGFQSLSAEVTAVDDDFIQVMTTIFGTKREMKVDPYDLRKVG